MRRARPRRSRGSWPFRTLALAGTSLLVACGSPDTRQSASVPASGVVEGFFPGADSVQLFYRKVGSGPATAVYLHGGGSSMADGGYEWDALATGRTLIAFDQRSGGRSQLVADSAKLSAEYYVRDVEALRVHFGLERMTLIGQSWGAMLAAMYTMKYPDRVERLLLLSPGSPTRAFLRQRVEKTNAVVGAAGVARIAELAQEMARAPDSTIGALCRERYALIFRAYLKDVTALSRMRVGYCDGSPAALRHELGAMDHLGLGEYDFLPQLAKMHIPALVVEGADTQVPLDATRAWAAALPNARLLLLQGARHILYLEGNVPRTTQLLHAFLNGGWPEGAEIVRQ